MPKKKGQAVIEDKSVAVPHGSYLKKHSLNGATSSTFIGVTLRKVTGQWQSEIRIDGKRRYLGTFQTQLEAAEAYNKAAAGTGKPLNKLPKGSGGGGGAGKASSSSKAGAAKAKSASKAPKSTKQVATTSKKRKAAAAVDGKVVCVPGASLSRFALCGL